MCSSSIKPPNAAAFQQELPKCSTKHLIFKRKLVSYCLYSHLLNFGRDESTLGCFSPAKYSEKLQRKKMQIVSCSVFMDEKVSFPLLLSSSALR